jgi:hypothetical protein
MKTNNLRSSYQSKSLANLGFGFRGFQSFLKYLHLLLKKKKKKYTIG